MELSVERSGDHWYRHAEAILRILADVQAHRGGDPARAYLTGFSFGANGVFDLALLQPEAWAALWAVDPTRVPTRAPARPVWLWVGAAARPARAAYIERLRLAAPGEGRIADRVVLDQGDDHVGCATRAYADARIYSWLLDRNR